MIDKKKQTEQKPRVIMKKDGEEKLKFDNQFEMMASIPDVKSGIKKNITSDYTMAKLGDADKEFMRENYQNAEYAKEIIRRFEQCTKPKWNSKTMEWDLNEDGTIKMYPLSDDEKLLINKRAERIFEFFMIQPHMIAILNRNRDDNFIVKLLGRFDNKEDEQGGQWVEDNRNALTRLIDKVKGNDGIEEVKED